MVKQRKAIEALYDGVCTITGSREVPDGDGVVEFEAVVICTDQPCHLSFGSSKTQTGTVATDTTQTITLFLAPEIVVPAGSHVVVTQNHATVEYNLSTTPAVYPTHQEIRFTLKDGWT